MTETVTVRMSRGDGNTPWGFRLQGGKEYGYPLSIGKVATGSLADRAGLKENDRVSQIAGRPADQLGHNEAQNAILSTGNALDLIVTRGASRVWAPTIDFPSGEDSTVKYSLTNDFKDTSASLAPGYSPQLQPGSGGGGSTYSSKTTKTSTRTRTTTQSPGGTYQQQHSPAEAYLQQTGGLFGTDPHLNQPPKEPPSYLHSETLKLIQQNEHGQGAHRPMGMPSPTHHGSADPIDPLFFQSRTFKRLSNTLNRAGSTTPTPRPVQFSPGRSPGDAGLVPGAPVCDSCGRSILGVFCKAGGKTLHGDCFKCATCGNSLKNVGYFLINEKLYCDIHARQLKEMGDRPVPRQRYSRQSQPAKPAYQPNIGGQPSSLSPGGGLQQNQSSSYKSTYSSNTSRTSSNVTGGGGPTPLPPSSAPFTTNFSNSISPGARTPVASKLGGAGPGGGQFAGPRASKRGRGILKHLHDGPRVPFCEGCRREIRGPFVLALSKTWCPDHFVCNTPSCRRGLIDIGFIEENGQIYCESCFEKYYAPPCSKCQRKVVGDCLTALQRQYHPECFTCTHCHKPFGNSSFFLENGQPFCENDWNQLFTTKCASCQFPIEAGDRWVEAMGGSYHSNCFSCTTCQKALEGQSFYAKAGRPYCKAHA